MFTGRMSSARPSSYSAVSRITGRARFFLQSYHQFPLSNAFSFFFSPQDKKRFFQNVSKQAFSVDQIEKQATVRTRGLMMTIAFVVQLSGCRTERTATR